MKEKESPLSRRDFLRKALGIGTVVVAERLASPGEWSPFSERDAKLSGFEFLRACYLKMVEKALKWWENLKGMKEGVEEVRQIIDAGKEEVGVDSLRDSLGSLGEVLEPSLEAFTKGKNDLATLKEESAGRVFSTAEEISGGVSFLVQVMNISPETGGKLGIQEKNFPHMVRGIIEKIYKRIVDFIQPLQQKMEEEDSNFRKEADGIFTDFSSIREGLDRIRLSLGAIEEGLRPSFGRLREVISRKEEFEKWKTAVLALGVGKTAGRLVERPDEEQPNPQETSGNEPEPSEDLKIKDKGISRREFLKTGGTLLVGVTVGVVIKRKEDKILNLIKIPLSLITEGETRVLKEALMSFLIAAQPFLEFYDKVSTLSSRLISFGEGVLDKINDVYFKGVEGLFSFASALLVRFSELSLGILDQGSQILILLMKGLRDFLSVVGIGKNAGRLREGLDYLITEIEEFKDKALQKGREIIKNIKNKLEKASFDLEERRKKIEEAINRVKKNFNKVLSLGKAGVQTLKEIRGGLVALNKIEGDWRGSRFGRITFEGKRREKKINDRLTVEEILKSLPALAPSLTSEEVELIRGLFKNQKGK